MVSKYDFRKPSKYSRSHIAGIRKVFETYCKVGSKFLETYFRTFVNIEIAGIREVSYDTYIENADELAVISIVDVPELQGKMVLEINTDLALAMIEKSLGGAGELGKEKRELTDIENIIMTDITDSLLQSLKESWQQISDINPVIYKMYNTNKIDAVTTLNDTAAIVTLEVNMGTSVGKINFCFPYQTMKNIINKLDVKALFYYVEKETTEEMKESLEERVEVAKVPITAILGEASLSVEDLMELQTGDVITLDTMRDSDFPVYVGHLKRFRAKPGIKNKKKAIQITEIVREDEI